MWKHVDWKYLRTGYRQVRAYEFETKVDPGDCGKVCNEVRDIH